MEVFMQKKYWGFILPSTLSFLLTGIYSIIDGIFVGRAMGDMGLAAINIAWPLVALIIALGTGIGMGASVMVSLNRGAGHDDAADQMEGNALFLLVVSSLILTGILYFFGSPLMTLLGAAGEVHTHAMTYLHYILYGAVIQTVASGLTPLMRNRGAAVYSMCAMACGCILNIILDYVLILVFPLGLMGAAIATVLGQLVTLIFALFFYSKKENRIDPSHIKPSGSAVKSILKVAASPFGLTYLPSITIILMNLQCTKYGGDEAVSAYAVLAYLVSFMELLVQGISDGAQPLLSLSKGQNDKKTLRSYTLLTFALGIGVGILSGSLMFLLRHQIPVFYGTSDAAAELIVHAAPAFSLVMALYGLTKPSVSYFYATEHLKQSSTLVYGEVLLTVGTILTLPIVLKLDGVWFTMPCVQIVLSVLAVLFLLTQKKEITPSE